MCIRDRLKATPYYYAYVNESDKGYLRQSPRLEIGSSAARCV